MNVRRRLAEPDLRPYWIFAAVVTLLIAADVGAGRFASQATVFSILQLFATLGPVTIGLALTMIVREFDISVAGMFGLAGVIAVIVGVENPILGVIAAVAVGAFGGAIQGLIMVRLGLSSIGVTLGGLLTFAGLAYVLTKNQSIPYDNMEVALAVNEPFFGVFSLRSVLALAVALAAAAVMAYLRVGRDIVAIGSDRRAATTAGVTVDRLLIGVFVVSGGLTALSGALLSYGLAAASPSGLADVLVPAAAAAILGGVSLAGGMGKPLGIATGVLVLCVIRSGLNALGVSPHVHDIATGAILLTVAVLDAPALAIRITELRLRWGMSR
jgi:ribose/xylose/arabinose/galactoside ABC-type transport system permease subunit